MTNNEALFIAANIDAVLEMSGMDFGYSLELLEESKKVKPLQDSLESIQGVLTKKVKPLHEKKNTLECKPEELVKIEAEIKAVTEQANAEWNKVVEAEFTGSFKAIDLKRVPTDSVNLDARIKDGVSIARAALIFLSRKGLTTN